MHLRGPMNVSKLAVYKLSTSSISKRSNTKFHDRKRKAKPLSIQADDMIQSEETSLASALEKRWFCTSTPTVTITIHIPGSTCGIGSTASIAPPPLPAPSVPAPALPPPAPPVPTPVIPPPSTAEPPTPSQPASTTTVHDTTTVCPKSSKSSVNGLSSALPPKSSLQDPSCPCPSTLETGTTRTDAPLPSASTSCSGTSEGMMTTQYQPVKRSEQKSAGSSTYTPATTLIPQPLRASDDVNKAAPPTWERVAYYTSSAPAAATGFAFLANLGDPQKSGTFD
jgi:hypothetical protein